MTTFNSSVPPPRISAPAQGHFSGHETFVLRAAWLKKGYDLLCTDPSLFAAPDAYVRLGVGKNMAQSIRHWLRVTGVAVRDPQQPTRLTPTVLGHQLLADDGWDPFLTTPLAAWLLHWQLTSQPSTAFTWYYTFNLLRGSEWTSTHLVRALADACRERDWSVPADTTLTRDVTCMQQCYVRPRRAAPLLDEPLLCPLLDLGIMHAIPGQSSSYRLTVGDHAELPDTLLAYTIQQLFARRTQQTLPLSELAYAPGHPGRVFCLTADALLARLYHLDALTDGAIRFSDQAGIRHVVWHAVDAPASAPYRFLAHGFAAEVGSR
ncbi:MAG: DUF4007 family protein [Chloroflexaceae bacterium]|nr:DUF4007 family protein [Chloroflexaceae bacterium]